jgi:regulatory protein
MSDPTRAARVDALRMLARRELSEAQVRQRLARRGHEQPAIDAAVTALRDQRSIDDTRTAEAIARTEVGVHRRGRRRVRLALEGAGIESAVANRAIQTVFEELDDAELLEASLARRLRPGARITTDQEFGRLYRYLLGQGFEPDRVVAVLQRRREE